MPLVPPYRNQGFYNYRENQAIPKGPLYRIQSEVNAEQNSYTVLNLNEDDNQMYPIPGLNEIPHPSACIFNLPNTVQDVAEQHSLIPTLSVQQFM